MMELYGWRWLCALISSSAQRFVGAPEGTIHIGFMFTSYGTWSWSSVFVSKEAQDSAIFDLAELARIDNEIMCRQALDEYIDQGGK